MHGILSAGRHRPRELAMRGFDPEGRVSNGREWLARGTRGTASSSWVTDRPDRLRACGLLVWYAPRSCTTVLQKCGVVPSAGQSNSIHTSEACSVRSYRRRDQCLTVAAPSRTPQPSQPSRGEAYITAGTTRNRLNSVFCAVSFRQSWPMYLRTRLPAISLLQCSTR